MKNINPLGLFDDQFIFEKLSKLGDPLERLNTYIDWDIFKAPLDKAFDGTIKEKAKGGRPSFDKLQMFKGLLIQSLYNLSDDQLEYQIINRASFKRFLGLKKSDKVPDTKQWNEKPHKLAQKDLDDRWTKKNNTVFYGYKNHIKANTKTKLIEEYIVTDASVHDYLRCYFVVTSHRTIANGERQESATLC